MVRRSAERFEICNVGETKIGGLLVQMLRFAVNIAMIAYCEENLNKILQKIYNTLKQDYIMNINKSKIKILIGSR